MKELTDYSGEFNPDIQFHDFSKDVLAELTRLYCKFHMSLDGFWYLTVMNEFNEETATKYDISVWEKQSRYEIKRITELLNIRERDIPAFFKWLQFNPFNWNMDHKLEPKSSNHGIWTVYKCPTLEALKKEGKGRDGYFCSTVELSIFETFARNFNPDIKVKYLKLPPRPEEEGICCLWEFFIEK